jgi:hypothetical protein
MMKLADAESFVATAARLHGLVGLDAEALARVVAVFQRNTELADLVLEFELPESISGPVYRL